MKEENLTAIAEKLHISKSTVSKVVRHCGGVDSETRNLVLQELKKIGYSYESHCPVYCILPDVPGYFWKEMRRGITEGELPEKASVKNCFYIGADSFQNGYEMGKVFLNTYKDRRLFVFSLTDNPNARKREAGFMQALLENDPEWTKKTEKIEISNSYMAGGKMFPARMAALLAKKTENDHQNGSKFCFYVPVGMNSLPLAVHKAGLKDRTVLLCHDCYLEYKEEGKQLYGGFSVTCNQDVFSQGLAAIRAASQYVESRNYPDRKEIFVESCIYREV